MQTRARVKKMLGRGDSRTCAHSLRTAPLQSAPMCSGQGVRLSISDSRGEGPPKADWSETGQRAMVRAKKMLGSGDARQGQENAWAPSVLVWQCCLGGGLAILAEEVR